jgi:hypothetical protein
LIQAAVDLATCFNDCDSANAAADRLGVRVIERDDKDAPPVITVRSTIFVQTAPPEIRDCYLWQALVEYAAAELKVRSWRLIVVIALWNWMRTTLHIAQTG